MINREKKNILGGPILTRMEPLTRSAQLNKGDTAR